MISYSFSSRPFNLLRVARHCFSWCSVSDDLYFSSCSFLVLYLFRILSSAFLSSVLSSSVSEALFALNFSFLREPCFFFLASFSTVEMNNTDVTGQPEEGLESNNIYGIIIQLFSIQYKTPIA